MSFLLLHGSAQNAHGWDRLRPALEAGGHDVVCPELPKSAPTWGLGDYAASVAAQVGATPPVVVAHSFSGVFLPLIAAQRPCALLVFLAAVIPEPGRSVRDQFAADPGMFGPAWIAAGPRWFDPAHREGLSREFLFHDCDPETLAFALPSVELCDTRHLVTEPAPFQRWPEVPAASIVATRDRTLTADWGRRTSRRVLGVESLDIDAGHCPHVSRPERLAAMLLDLAGMVGNRGSVRGTNEVTP